MRSGANVADLDHSPPVVYICYHVAYIFELQTGQKWSRLPAFALQAKTRKKIPYKYLDAISVHHEPEQGTKELGYGNSILAEPEI